MKHPLPADFSKCTVANFKNPPDDEQELVRLFFQNRKDGYYVDVGANDPVIESQTWHLEQLGWDGLLVEPLASYCAVLRKERRGRVAQYACSAPENQDKVLRLLVAGGHSTLNEAPIALGTESDQYEEVTCKTLDSVLAENQVRPGFEFISIDIEGHEMEMFKGFTLPKWKPALVLLEDHVTSHEKHNFMKANGYQLIMRTGLNSWYVPADAGYKLSFYAKLQFFRKYYLGLLGRKIKYAR